MESGKNKITNKQQLQKMVELMEKHPDTGRGKPQFGSTKNKMRELWDEFAIELNSLGPPSRTAVEWARVWIHYKANLKRKLANSLKNFILTRGGSTQEVSLNPLEESVAQLVQIREQVAAGGIAFGINNLMDDEVDENNFLPASSTADKSQELRLENRTLFVGTSSSKPPKQKISGN